MSQNVTTHANLAMFQSRIRRKSVLACLLLIIRCAVCVFTRSPRVAKVTGERTVKIVQAGIRTHATATASVKTKLGSVSVSQDSQEQHVSFVKKQANMGLTVHRIVRVNMAPATMELVGMGLVIVSLGTKERVVTQKFLSVRRYTAAQAAMRNGAAQKSMEQPPAFVTESMSLLQTSQTAQLATLVTTLYTLVVTTVVVSTQAQGSIHVFVKRIIMEMALCVYP
jgi:hypothetical protein